MHVSNSEPSSSSKRRPASSTGSGRAARHASRCSACARASAPHCRARRRRRSHNRKRSDSRRPSPAHRRKTRFHADAAASGGACRVAMSVRRRIRRSSSPAWSISRETSSSLSRSSSRARSASSGRGCGGREDAPVPWSARQARPTATACLQNTTSRPRGQVHAKASASPSTHSRTR